MKISFDEDAGRNRSELQRKEWLEVNGRGGYASLSVTGAPTRKYHGLLVANLTGAAAGRHVLVNAVLDSLTAAGSVGSLSTLEQVNPGAIPPAANLRSFVLDLVPTWVFRVGPAEIEKSIVAVQGEDTVVIRYCLARGEGRLRVHPLLSFRRNHEMGRENHYFRTHATLTETGFFAAPYDGMPEIHVAVDGARPAQVETVGQWFQQVFYRQEEERGFAAAEDLCGPAAVTVNLEAGTPVYITLSTLPNAKQGGQLWEEEMSQRRRSRKRDAAFMRNRFSDAGERGVACRLSAAAAQFVIQAPPNRMTVLAGYHWFEDWGRDTMIALPGLTFARGQAATGLAILKTFIAAARNGRIPNYIGPAGVEPSYNSVDASLWLFWTVQQYLQFGGSRKTAVKELWPVLKTIIQAYSRAQWPDVRMTEEGLLYCGTPDTQLTWMDACASGRPVTPRWGLPVEINALWYNALAVAADLAAAAGDSSYQPPVSLDSLAAAFRKTFWLPDHGFLADVVNEKGQDIAIRPNQIFAVSLPCSPLLPEQAAAVTACVRQHLLTPCGLRTLSPDDPAYQGRYAGNPDARDAAYHQGTVWPWLLGAFGEAWLKVNNNSETARAFLRETLTVWSDHLEQAGLGTVSEIFDGDPPHLPNGCIAQAWSVAELLRLYLLLRK